MSDGNKCSKGPPDNPGELILTEKEYKEVFFYFFKQNKNTGPEWTRQSDDPKISDLEKLENAERLKETDKAAVRRRTNKRD